MERGIERVTQREDTKADDCFNRLNEKIFSAIFTAQ